MEKRWWQIEGFDGTKSIFKIRVPVHLLGEKQAEEVLRRLVSQHLSKDEIIGASLNRKDKRSTLLDVKRTSLPFVLSCGENPFYVARIETE
ncbi:hypothetical protein [Hirschia baltica]|uniref:Uncharacterized protein n=1 Tax=Hirschia baltica (strain ATCC 49814 / DSM 5838 / IFAM 1418) TaxID=582402 RepID=C6XMP0_HIRBI|nr:hypothetical protein [Hirschia baltica]ACT59954.1 hypothetical protein Hbal_2274 [Hirschia baltica ATCC 49814]